MSTTGRECAVDFTVPAHYARAENGEYPVVSHHQMLIFRESDLSEPPDNYDRNESAKYAQKYHYTTNVRSAIEQNRK